MNVRARVRAVTAREEMRQGGGCRRDQEESHIGGCRREIECAGKSITWQNRAQEGITSVLMSQCHLAEGLTAQFVAFCACQFLGGLEVLRHEINLPCQKLVGRCYGLKKTKEEGKKR